MSSIAADPPPGASLSVGQTARRQLHAGQVWALALTAGLIAGFASWAIGETYHGRFDPPAPKPTSGIPSPAELTEQFMARETARTSETILAFGALGAALGLALGLAGGLARGSAGTAVIAAIGGSIAGGSAGTAMARLLLPIYLRSMRDPANADLILAILILGGNWSVIGAVGGAAFGCGLGDRWRTVGAMLGGLLGAIAGVFIYEMVGAVVFPLDGITDPLSNTSVTRLFARLAVTTLASAGAAFGALNLAKRATTSPVSAEHHP